MRLGILGKTYEASIIASLLKEDNKIELKFLKKEYAKITAKNICFYNNIEELINSCDVIILDIEKYNEFLLKYEKKLENKLIIFINTSIKGTDINKYTSSFMIVAPNIGSYTFDGYSLVCKNRFVNEKKQQEYEEVCHNIFKNIGQIKIINEQELGIYNEIVNNSILYFEVIMQDMAKYFKDTEMDYVYLKDLLANSMKIAADKMKYQDYFMSEELIKSSYFYNDKTKKSLDYIRKIELENIYASKKSYYEIRLKVEED